MKKAAEYLAFALVVLLIVSAVLTYLAPHFGWRVDAVLTGSMEPRLKVGSLIIVRPVKPETIVVGDIITFSRRGVDGLVITHRVIGIGGKSPFLNFETKGDANDNSDQFTVSALNLAGKVSFHAPYLGYITEFIKTPWGFMVALVAPALAILALYIRIIRRSLSRGNRGRPDRVVEEERGTMAKPD